MPAPDEYAIAVDDMIEPDAEPEVEPEAETPEE